MLRIDRVEVAVKGDKFKKTWFSFVPYREVALEFTVSGEGDADLPPLMIGRQRPPGQMSYDILVADDAIFDIPTTSWSPICKRHVDGILYVVWNTEGTGVGKYHAESGIWLKGNVRWRESLLVHLKPDITRLALRWQFYEDGVEFGDCGESTVELHSAGGPFLWAR